MQKILMAFILLCTAFTTAYAQDTQRKKEKDGRILQLTKDAKLTDLIDTIWVTLNPLPLKAFQN